MTEFETLKKLVCEFYNIPVTLLDKKTRKMEVVRARQICHHYAQRNNFGRLRVIGEKIGGKDHATVLHSCNTVNNLYETDKYFRSELQCLYQRLDAYFNSHVIAKDILAIEEECHIDKIIEQLHVHNYLQRMNLIMKKQIHEKINNLQL